MNFNTLFVTYAVMALVLAYPKYENDKLKL